MSMASHSPCLTPSDTSLDGQGHRIRTVLLAPDDVLASVSRHVAAKIPPTATASNADAAGAGGGMGGGGASADGNGSPASLSKGTQEMVTSATSTGCEPDRSELSPPESPPAHALSAVCTPSVAPLSNHVFDELLPLTSTAEGLFEVVAAPILKQVAHGLDGAIVVTGARGASFRPRLGQSGPGGVSLVQHCLESLQAVLSELGVPGSTLAPPAHDLRPPTCQPSVSVSVVSLNATSYEGICDFLRPLSAPVTPPPVASDMYTFPAQFATEETLVSREDIADVMQRVQRSVDAEESDAVAVWMTVRFMELNGLERTGRLLLLEVEESGGGVELLAKAANDAMARIRADMSKTLSPAAKSTATRPPLEHLFAVAIGGRCASAVLAVLDDDQDPTSGEGLGMIQAASRCTGLVGLAQVDTAIQMRREMETLRMRYEHFLLTRIREQAATQAKQLQEASALKVAEVEARLQLVRDMRDALLEAHSSTELALMEEYHRLQSALGEANARMASVQSALANQHRASETAQRRLNDNHQHLGEALETLHTEVLTFKTQHSQSVDVLQSSLAATIKGRESEAVELSQLLGDCVEVLKVAQQKAATDVSACQELQKSRSERLRNSNTALVESVQSSVQELSGILKDVVTAASEGVSGLQQSLARCRDLTDEFVQNHKVASSSLSASLTDKLEGIGAAVYKAVEEQRLAVKSLSNRVHLSGSAEVEAADLAHSKLVETITSIFQEEASGAQRHLNSQFDAVEDKLQGAESGLDPASEGLLGKLSEVLESARTDAAGYRSGSNGASGDGSDSDLSGDENHRAARGTLGGTVGGSAAGGVSAENEPGMKATRPGSTSEATKATIEAVWSKMDQLDALHTSAGGQVTEIIDSLTCQCADHSRSLAQRVAEISSVIDRQKALSRQRIQLCAQRVSQRTSALTAALDADHERLRESSAMLKNPQLRTERLLVLAEAVSSKASDPNLIEVPEGSPEARHAAPTPAAEDYPYPPHFSHTPGYDELLSKHHQAWAAEVDFSQECARRAANGLDPYDIHEAGPPPEKSNDGPGHLAGLPTAEYVELEVAARLTGRKHPPRNPSSSVSRRQLATDQGEGFPGSLSDALSPESRPLAKHKSVRLVQSASLPGSDRSGMSPSASFHVSSPGSALSTGGSPSISSSRSSRSMTPQKPSTTDRSSRPKAHGSSTSGGSSRAESKDGPGKGSSLNGARRTASSGMSRKKGNGAPSGSRRTLNSAGAGGASNSGSRVPGGLPPSTSSEAELDAAFGILTDEGPSAYSPSFDE